MYQGHAFNTLLLLFLFLLLAVAVLMSFHNVAGSTESVSEREPE